MTTPAAPAAAPAPEPITPAPTTPALPTPEELAKLDPWTAARVRLSNPALYERK